MATRRDFLKAAALAAGSAALPAIAPSRSQAAPVERAYGPKMKLSLAAYSLRSQLPRNGTAEQLANAKLTLEGFIDYCASLGLEGTELTGYYFPAFVQETPIHRPPDNPGTTDPDRVDAAVEYINGLKNRAFRLGLDVSGTAIGNDFCVPEGPAWVAQINDCKDWIDRAAVLGAPVIRIFAGKVPPGDTEANAIRRCAAAIDECLKYAGRRGVFLALENHGGITSTPEQLLRIVEAVKPSPWFGINFDSGNFRTEEPYRDLELIAPYAVNAQVKVAIAPNGKKQPADLARLVEILKAAKYRGYVVLEYEEPEDPFAEIPKYIDQLRNLIAS